MILIKKNKLSFLITFLLLIFSAIYGLIMRWNFAFPMVDFNFRSVVEAHSHVAFLGWGYLTTVLLILEIFTDKIKRNNKLYKITITICCASVLLLLVSFLLNGYGIYSIALLSVFGISSLILTFLILKDLKKGFISEKLVRFGFYYYILSSIATWVIPIIIATQGKSVLYHNAIYFYLHFLYNGFFVFVLFGIIFKIFERQKIILNPRYIQLFFVFLNLACIPAYVLSILWSTNYIWINTIGFAAGILQIISGFYLLLILMQVLNQLKWHNLSKILFKFTVGAYFFKIIMQLVSAFPIVIKTAIGLKPFFIIGYLHLFTLGFMSTFLILMLNLIHKIAFTTVSSKLSLIIFLFGIFITETLLFFQGGILYFFHSSIKYFNMLLFYATLIMVSGLLILFFANFKKLGSVKN